jgi:hypothetical protein
MIATKPAVEAHISRVRRTCCVPRAFTYEKRKANRLHRRELNHLTFMIMNDPERWWDEPFTVASLSTWDLW